MPTIHPPNLMMGSSPINAPNAAPGVSSSVLGAPHLQQHPFPPFYEQHLPHKPDPFIGHGHPEYDQSFRSFKGLSRPLPSDVEMELNGVLNSLTGTKESIKGAKTWFMQRSPFVPALAEALRDRIYSLDDPERQLHVIFLANDILFDSMQRRVNHHELDNQALAFKPVLGSMLSRIFCNPLNKGENQSRLKKILRFWASKDVFDQDTIHGLENEMVSGLAQNSLPGPHSDLPAVALDPSVAVGGPHQLANHNTLQWRPDKQNLVPSMPVQEQALPIPSMPQSLAPQQFHLVSVPSSEFTGSTPVPSLIQQSNQPPAHLSKVGERLPPYPLFPRGLIPGMVRKMQIGSGVPCSPMSPLDIPTVIPPSNISPSEINERVLKFFREIGEVNASEGAVKPSESREAEEYVYERELPIRKGGSCIPPPPGLNLDPNSETFNDGSIEQKPGSGSFNRSGLGATADPNEASQYDDVYSSYRKDRSTNFHSSMSAIAAPR